MPSLRLVLRPRRLMRIRATGKEIREGSSYSKSTHSTSRIRVLYIVESSYIMIRERKRCFGAGTLYIWAVGASLQT